MKHEDDAEISANRSIGGMGKKVRGNLEASTGNSVSGKGSAAVGVQRANDRDPNDRGKSRS